MNLMYGTVQQVYPPGHSSNLNKFQYEYMVLVTGDGYAQIPLSHVLKSDEFGSADEFDDATLKEGQKVLVMCMKDYSQAMIVGAIRNTRRIMDASLGHHALRRFNGVEQMIDKLKNWSVKSDQGPNINVKTDSIILDDSTGESITLDKANKIITVQANAWKMVVQGACDIQVLGDATLQANSLTATVTGKTSLKTGSAEVNADGDVKVNAKGKAQVNGSEIDLNGADGAVVTTMTHPVDFVTGIPIMGSSKVKAGT
jgi:hypothetical protein